MTFHSIYCIRSCVFLLIFQNQWSWSLTFCQATFLLLNPESCHMSSFVIVQHWSLMSSVVLLLPSLSMFLCCWWNWRLILCPMMQFLRCHALKCASICMPLLVVSDSLSWCYWRLFPFLVLDSSHSHFCGVAQCLKHIIMILTHLIMTSPYNLCWWLNWRYHFIHKVVLLIMHRGLIRAKHCEHI